MLNTSILFGVVIQRALRPEFIGGMQAFNNMLADFFRHIKIK